MHEFLSKVTHSDLHSGVYTNQKAIDFAIDTHQGLVKKALLREKFGSQGQNDQWKKPSVVVLDVKLLVNQIHRNPYRCHTCHKDLSKKFLHLKSSFPWSTSPSHYQPLFKISRSGD